MKKKHCWHGDGTILLTDPPQIPLTCCNCGKMKLKKINHSPFNLNGHGKYLLVNDISIWNH